jgi:membrane glycosyltransferase
VTTFSAGCFLITLPFGRVVQWSGQARDAHALGLRDAARALWPHAMFGGFLMMFGFVVSPDLLIWSLPLTFGYVAAIPFAVATASPRLGEACKRLGLFRTPEEYDFGRLFPKSRPASRVLEDVEREAVGSS